MKSADEGVESEERGRAIVQTLAVVVESMVQASERVAPLGFYQKTKFEAFRAPGISVRDYLTRIHKYASCSPECFVLALVYMDRLHQMQSFVLTELNVHRVVITSVVLAAKFFDDHYFNNAYYAKVGGVPCVEMNELEVEYLLLINFSLHVSSDTYARYYNELANHYIFTSVRNSTLPHSPYFQLRHFVAPDPAQQGALVYVTESYPKVPMDHAQQQQHAHAHSHAMHQPMQIPTPQHQQQQQHQHRRTIEDGVDAASAGAGAVAAPTTSATSGGIACTAKSSRASGQKRRSAVALGVNA